jgi:membrane fusion protein, multidrug efflux system
MSEQAALEGQIGDEARRIAALVSAVSVAQANIESSEADVTRWGAAVEQARADVANAEQGVERARAEWTYANSNLHRLQPLLVKRFVTADQVDKAASSELSLAQALKQAESQVRLSQAGLLSALAQFEHSKTVLQQSKAQHQQAQHAVTTLEPLINQRGERAAAVKTARYNLDNCRVYAPFDARVTNLLISEGAYAHVGQQMFLLIDARRWWALANFREGQLQHIAPGMHADVYVMSKPNLRFSGVVDSIGFGVTPDADRIGRFDQGQGLPDIQRTLNWVHLASRYPVRVLVQNPLPDLFRVSESAVVVIR